VPRQRAIVDAFLAASRNGDFEALVAMLDPHAVLRADDTAVEIGAEREIRGAEPVAKTFAGRARVARPALVDGAPGLVWAPRGRPRVVFLFAFAGDTVSSIELIAEPERIAALDLVMGDS
jgi:RNA polymerase sigma-70 factor (ECF subfamily)